MTDYIPFNFQKRVKCFSFFKKKRQIFISSIIILIFLLILSGCSKKVDFSTDKDLKEQNRYQEFEVYNVKKRSIKRDMIGLGNLEVLNKATITSPIDGNLREIYVKKGDRVNTGDRLFYLSNYNLEIEYARSEKAVIEAKEGLATSQIQYEEEKKALYKKFIAIEKKGLEIRNMEEELSYLEDAAKKKKLLFDNGGMTEEAYNDLLFSLKTKRHQLEIMNKEYELSEYGFRDSDIVSAGYEIPNDKHEREKLLVFINTALQRKRVELAKISLKRSELDRDRMNWLMNKRLILSPIGGVVTDVGKFIGEKIKADDTLTTVIDVESLIARVSFTENDLSLFKKGMNVNLEIESIKEKLEGKIYTIDPYINKETRAVRIDCLIKNSIEKGTSMLLPGMFVKVVIPVNRREDSVVVPKSSVLIDGDENGYVFIVSKDGRIYRRRVIWEEYNDKESIIREGLKEGDIVVLNPNDRIQNGEKIKVKI